MKLVKTWTVPLGKFPGRHFDGVRLSHGPPMHVWCGDMLNVTIPFRSDCDNLRNDSKLPRSWDCVRDCQLSG